MQKQENNFQQENLKEIKFSQSTQNQQIIYDNLKNMNKESSASDNTKYQFQIQKNSGFQQYTSTIQSSDEKHSSIMTVQGKNTEN